MSKITAPRIYRPVVTEATHSIHIDPNEKPWAQSQITTVGKTVHTWKTVDIWNQLFKNLLIDEKLLHLEHSSHCAGK